MDFFLLLLFLCTFAFLSVLTQAAVITHATRNRQTAGLPAPSYQQNEWCD